MRKHLSVLGLWIRGTFLGAVGILALTAAVELGLVWWRLEAVRAGEISGFAALVDQSRIRFVFAAGLTGLWAWLLYVGSAARRNTLGRLNVAEEKITLWHAVCCVGWLCVFWAVQIAVALAGYRMFLGAVDPAAVSGQSLYLACYQDGLLHWLLPLDDLWSAAELVLSVLTLGFTTAVDGSCQRRRRRLSDITSLMALLFLVLFPMVGGKPSPWVWMLVLPAFVLLGASRLRQGWKEGNDR